MYVTDIELHNFIYLCLLFVLLAGLRLGCGLVTNRLILSLALN